MSDIPLDFLLTCSTNSLSEYQLRRLNEATNLRRKAMELIEQAMDEEVEARLACWLRMHREAIFRTIAAIGQSNDAETAFKLWFKDHGEEMLRLVGSEQKLLKP